MKLPKDAMSLLEPISVGVRNARIVGCQHRCQKYRDRRVKKFPRRRPSGSRPGRARGSRRVEEHTPREIG